MINRKLNFFSRKKILIYGLGKSGISAFEFLKKKSEVLLFDDFQDFEIEFNTEPDRKHFVSKELI